MRLFRSGDDDDDDDDDDDHGDHGDDCNADDDDNDQGNGEASIWIYLLGVRSVCWTTLMMTIMC